jgi:hypothetical protein
VIADALREFGGGTAFFDYAKHIALGNGLAGELVIRERQEVGGQSISIPRAMLTVGREDEIQEEAEEETVFTGWAKSATPGTKLHCH